MLSRYPQHTTTRPALYSIHWPRSHLSRCHRMKVEACPFSHASSHLFSVFFFSFSLAHASSLSLSFYLSEADPFQRPILLCFPCTVMTVLPSSLSLHYRAWARAVSGILKTTHPRVRRTGYVGVEVATQDLCVQALCLCVRTLCPEPE